MADRKSLSPAALGPHRSEVGESPVWDARTETLLSVDLLAGRLLRTDLSGGTQVVAQLDEPLGFVAPGPGDRLVAGTRSGVGLLDPAAGSFELALPIERDRPEYRINDGQCDRQGRLWLGTMCDRDPRAGRIHRIDPDWTVGFTRGDMLLPNGLAWSLDGETMYLADSTAGRVEIFDYDTDDGRPRGLRNVITIPSDEGQPDGMVVDEADCLWVATWRGGTLRRYDADGRLLDEFDVGVPIVASCAFGGSTLSTLFITTAFYGLTEEERRRAPLAGALMRAETTVRGGPVDGYRLRSE